jgi:hypothetical protein
MESHQIRAEAIVGQGNLYGCNSVAKSSKPKPILNSVSVPCQLRALRKRLGHERGSTSHKEHLINAVNINRIRGRAAHKHNTVPDLASERTVPCYTHCPKKAELTTREYACGTLQRYK